MNMDVLFTCTSLMCQLNKKRDSVLQALRRDEKVCVNTYLMYGMPIHYQPPVLIILSQEGTPYYIIE